MSDVSPAAVLIRRAMRFARLARTDIRESFGPGEADPEAEFAAWWLLHGRTEYPAVWGWGAAEAEAAMRPAPGSPHCPRLLRRLHRDRADLRMHFNPATPEGLLGLLRWYRRHGPMELAAAPPLPPACQTLIGGPPMPPLAGAEPPSAPPPGGTMPDGVNVIGFVRGCSGLGEDARAAAAALRAAGVPFCLIDAATTRDGEEPPGPSAVSPGLSAESPVYSANLYCMSAFDAAALWLRRGEAWFGPHRHRIGHWPWELPRFPDAWTGVYDLVDEIWTGSAFTAEAYRANCPKPVHRLPCPVPPPRPAALPRAALPVRPDAFLFLYAFDPGSYLARKNPGAAVRAFRAAFPPGERLAAALILRVNGRLDDHPEGRALRREIAGDGRVAVIEGGLERAHALGLLAAADCFLSPHRAEGFGRNIAEALLLEVPVLATGFSGNVDFLAPEEAIPYRLTPVRPGEYPYGEGQAWAEPSVPALAARMRDLVLAGGKDRDRLRKRRRAMEAAYGVETAGLAFMTRLRTVLRSPSGRCASPIAIPVVPFRPA